MEGEKEEEKRREENEEGVGPEGRGGESIRKQGGT